MRIIEPGPTLERWNHIFNSDGRALIVALDHIPGGMLPGWEFPDKTLEKVLEGRPDAVMANFGILKQYSRLFSDKVGRILRIDGGPSYLLENWPEYTRWEAFYTVEDAINVGADGIIANLFIGGSSEVDCFLNASRAAADCLRLNVLCAFEPIPSSKLMRNDYAPESIAFSCRMAAEFGADFIKTLYTGQRESFHYVTSRCPVPVLMAGGPKTDIDQSLLESVRGMLDAGGCGIFVGRNVWQHDNPVKILRALGKLIHEDSTVEIALKELSNTVSTRDVRNQSLSRVKS